MKVDHAMARTSSSAEHDFIDTVINRHVGRPGAVLAILQQAQNNHPRKYLPLETLEYIARKTGLPQSQIYSVATFYALFNLKPQGRNTISVCRGTACHTRGSRDLHVNLLSKFGSHLSSDDEGEQLSVTTPDGFVTVRTVACFGQCALAPVIEINHAVLGHMNETTLERELETLDRKGAA